MSKQRILILTNRVPYPLNDGGNLATHAMVEGYKKQGWHVYLLSMNTTRHNVPKEVLARLYKDLYAFETVAVDNDVTIPGTLKNLLFSSLPNHAERFYTKAFADKLEDVLKNFSPDVVQVESIFLSQYLTLIQQSNACTVLRLHNIEGQIWHRLAAQTENAFKHWYLKNLASRIHTYETQAWEQYDLLVPITETDAAVVKQDVPNADILTISFGIDTNKIQPSVKEEWVGYHIGAMDWLPNQQAISWFVKEAWPLIQQKAPGFNFHFAGRNMPAYFNGLSSNGIKCEGEVADADAFIADKKILIVPLFSGGGIRVKILEAMAAGKLVISTTIGMQGIDAITGTHYLQANTPQEFADAIAWALANKDKATEIAANAAALIKERYNADAIAIVLSDKVSTLSAT